MLTRRWRDLGLTFDDADFTGAQAVAAIVRMTGGNFRLLHRLFVQIERILWLNELTIITEDVVEVARSTTAHAKCITSSSSFIFFVLCKR